MQRRCLDIPLVYEWAVTFNIVHFFENEASVYVFNADSKLLMNIHNFNETHMFFSVVPQFEKEK